MTFLTNVARFGPDLDKCRQQHPNPFTYEPVHPDIATTAPRESANRYGSFGPHHNKQIEAIAASSDAAAFLAAVQPSPQAPQSVRFQSPSPWQYTPQIDSQFDRVFTVKDLQILHRRRVDAVHRTAAARVSPSDRPIEVQRLALGPGTYEVDKDHNLEPVSVPFSFPKAPRGGILECRLGEVDLRSDHDRIAKYEPRLGEAPRRRSETALLPLRRISSPEPHKNHQDIAVLSKELAKSYADLHKSASRLERKLSSPVVRSMRYERFSNHKSDTLAFCRGPGSYFNSEKDPSASADALAVVTNLPLDDQQRQELEALLQTKHTTPKQRTRSTFGAVKHRDLLTSMAKAGHLSTTAVEDAISPGIYATATSPFDQPTHNVQYKRLPPTTKSASTKSVDSTGDDVDVDGKQRWQAMKHGPQWN